MMDCPIGRDVGGKQGGDLTEVCEAICWKGRDAMRLANGVIEVIALVSGGHVASIRFLSGSGKSDVNVMWEAPWETLDGVEEWSQNLIDTYGPVEVGRFLAGYTGHALCLHYFGAPLPAGVAAGRSLHGEAAGTRWKMAPVIKDGRTHLRCTTDLPIAGLHFQREIRLGSGKSVIYVEETVCNLRDEAHRCDWVQHVTFGSPFLCEQGCTLNVSACRGVTSEDDYDGRSLLKAGTEFVWPMALHSENASLVDLSRPFSDKTRGFLAGLQLDTSRKQEFLIATNWDLHIGLAYCFQQSVFPWMTVWEENCAREATPWNGTTVARGMEFGTSPLPFGEQDAHSRREVFGLAPGFEIPAGERRTARYIVALFDVPDDVKSISKIEAVGDEMVLYGDQGDKVFSIDAMGCESFLTEAVPVAETFLEHMQ